MRRRLYAITEQDSYYFFGSIGTSEDKYSAIALAPNGKLYCPPLNASGILCIDPANDTYTTFGYFSGTYKYRSIALAPNGKLYCAPYDTNTILCIDPANNTYTTFGNISGSAKYRCIAMAPNGKLYAAPYNATNILCIDPSDNSYTTFGSISGSYKYEGIALAPNGKLYCAPLYYSYILCIDPSNNTFTTFGTRTSTYRYQGMALAPNGKLYSPPYSATDILCVDPANNTFSTFGNIPGSERYRSIALAPNGKLYCAPNHADGILCIDPANNTYTTFGSIPGNYKYVGSALAPNGKLYCAPLYESRILVIVPTPPLTPPTISIEPHSLSIPATGQTLQPLGYVTSSSPGWTYVSNQAWLAVKKQTSAAGERQLVYTSAANTGEARTATVTVRTADGTASDMLVVTQAAAEIWTIEASPSLLEFEWNGVSDSVYITCNTDWDVQSKPDWLECIPDSGYLDTVVMIQVQENPGYAREGQIVFQNADASDTATVTVRQSAHPVIVYSNVSAGQIRFAEMADGYTPEGDYHGYSMTVLAEAESYKHWWNGVDNFQVNDNGGNMVTRGLGDSIFVWRYEEGDYWTVIGSFTLSSDTIQHFSID
ncbi:MAG: hypothetical protein LBR26_13225 [Prevotella sp.]|jgi:streptogramin lyase|nr:hypothetical protein [Prevotella sp.]